MALPIETSALSDVLVILGATGIVIPAFHSLRLSPVVGFILVGMLVGPHGLGALTGEFPWLNLVTITHRVAVEAVAEVGIVLLMFVVGLELSFERLKTMRRLVFGLGTAQVAVTTGLIAAALALALGLRWEAAAIVGFALSLSSTAIVLPILSEEKALVSGPGRASFAILLFQDLALIPALFVLSTLGAGGSGIGPDTVAAIAVKGGAALAVLILLSRYAVRPALQRAARAKSPELFMAASLLIVLGAAVITAAAGLSLVIGALIAGLLIADTEYRRQVEVTVEPFKGLLLGVFLISVGMELDLAAVAEQPLLVAAGVVALVAVKTLVAAPMIAWFGGQSAGAARAGLLLGPSGEMSLIILAAAGATGLVAGSTIDIATVVTALAMTAIPLLSRLGLTVESRRAVPVLPFDLVPDADADSRVLVIGFGRVGQLVADMLDVHGVPYIAIDSDADAVARQRRAGRPIHYGDASQPDYLTRLGLDAARAMVLTTNDAAVTERIVDAVRAENPDLQIIARARDARHAARLYRAGVSDAVPETVESSLQLSEAVLVDLGVPMGPVIASIHEKRADLRAQIQAMVPGLHNPPTLGRRRLRDGVRPA